MHSRLCVGGIKGDDGVFFSRFCAFFLSMRLTECRPKLQHDAEVAAVALKEKIPPVQWMPFE